MLKKPFLHINEETLALSHLSALLTEKFQFWHSKAHENLPGH